jgi:hypothetical protein
MRNCWKLRSGKALFFIIFFVFCSGAQGQRNPYLFPVRPGQQNYLSGTMGEMRGAHFHAGIDIKTGGVEGLNIYAAADGYVSRIKVAGGGYGNALYIAHPQLGTTTVYGHLQKYNEEIADYVLNEQYRRKSFNVDLYPERDLFPVKKGDVVALSGNSGSSAGPHLHFEIRDDLQRPLNVLDFGFSEIEDDISPTVQRIALKTLNKNSRINHQFGLFEFTPSRVGNEYSVSKPIEVYGEIGVLVMGYDRLNNASNRNGVPNLNLNVDSTDMIDITIDRIPFNKSRNILTYRDYELKATQNKSFRKLYIDDGNELNVFKTNGNKGILSVRDTLLHPVKITLRDAYGNESVITMKLQGKLPETTVLEDKPGFKPIRHKVVDNTLVFMGKKAENNGYFAQVHADRMNYEISSSYYVNDYSVYLWDLRQGIPDSIVLCGETIYPGLEMTVPSASYFRYYKDEFDLHFYEKTLFDTLYLKTDYINELLDGREIFEISEDLYPLRRNMKVSLKPRLNYKNKEKISAYYTTDLKQFSYQGGEWKNGNFEFLTRTLGKYTLLPDTVPPKIRVLQQNRDHFRCYITDERSGIRDYELKINDQWVLMNYDPKRNYIWAEKLDKSIPFSGDLELKVRDNVNNEKIYQTTIN